MNEWVSEYAKPVYGTAILPVRLSLWHILDISISILYIIEDLSVRLCVSRIGS